MKRILFAALALLAGCTPAPAPPVKAASLPPATPEASAATSAPPPPVPFGKAPADLHDVRWDRLSLPAPFCGITGLVPPATQKSVPSTVYGRVYVFHDVQDVQYGDVDGDGRDEALIGMGCHNGGGTAAGQLGFAELVVTARAGRLVAMGAVEPLLNPDDGHPPLIRKVEALRGRVVLTESFYREGDANCCPSGTAVTEWVWSGTGLIPGAPRITG